MYIVYKETRWDVKQLKNHTHKDVYLISTPLNNLLMTHISYDPMATPTPYTALPSRAASALLFIEHCYGFCQSFTRSLFCWFILYLIFRLDIRRCWLPNQFANAILLIVFNIRYTNLLSLYCQNASYNPSKVFEILTKCELYICIL